jgi:hypothetical protein
MRQQNLYFISGQAGTYSHVVGSDEKQFREFERRSVRVLVVEDDPLISEFVVEALREEGFQVIRMGKRRLRGAAGGLPTCSSPTSDCQARWTAGKSPSAVESIVLTCRSSTQPVSLPWLIDRWPAA